jgi:hypothetical protein
LKTLLACLLPLLYGRSFAQAEPAGKTLARAGEVEMRWSRAPTFTEGASALALLCDQKALHVRVLRAADGQLLVTLHLSRGALKRRLAMTRISEGNWPEEQIAWADFGGAPREGEVLQVRIGQGPDHGWEPLAGVPKPAEILLLPYVYAGVDERHNTGVLDAGLDVQSQYKDVRFRGSFVPDFRNIEKDILSLDFSYFERLPRERRPFFLDGSRYFDTAFFAPQRIVTFDAAAKVFGNLGPKSTVAFLDAADFWQANALVANVTHRFDRNGVVSAAFKSFHEPEFTNEFASANGVYKIGSLRLAASAQLTHDTAFGPGSSLSGSLDYDRAGTFAHLSGVQTTANFLDRLGYYTETNVRGVDAAGGHAWSYQHGPIARAVLSAYTSQYRYLDGSPYRDYLGATASIEMRKGPSVSFSALSGRFLENQDRTLEAVVSQRIGGMAEAGVDVTAGNLASHSYLSALLYASVTPTAKLRLDGSIQQVRHYENAEQAIVTLRYEKSPREMIAGRLVQFRTNLNWYLQYSRGGGRSPEFDLILGDPNTPRFQRALVLKVIWPLSVKFR